MPDLSLGVNLGFGAPRRLEQYEEGYRLQPAAPHPAHQLERVRTLAAMH